MSNIETTQVLLVDDDYVTVLLVKMTLERLDPSFNLKVVSNGDEALSFIVEEGIPDVIFLDINMPVLNGFEFLRELTRWEIEVPHICILSNYVRMQDKDELIKLGCSTFIEKPITNEKLKSVIKSLQDSVNE